MGSWCRLSRRGGQRQAGPRNTEGPPRQGRDAEGRRVGGRCWGYGSAAGGRRDLERWQNQCQVGSGRPLRGSLVSSLGALPLSP